MAQIIDVEGACQWLLIPIYTNLRGSVLDYSIPPYNVLNRRAHSWPLETRVTKFVMEFLSIETVVDVWGWLVLT
jgi:hypothetical protein